METGLTQKSLLSQIMFRLALDKVMRLTNKDQQEESLEKMANSLEDIDFTNALCLFAHNLANVEDMMEELDGEEMNEDSKYMKQNETRKTIEISGIKQNQKKKDDHGLRSNF
ncbi:hypothetical protein HHI36_008470 [Cryptolaemus montrouzieri]|uniref:Uncharacterized protein n=1 Tax=Cryptolaemus montrouzieri TaxID=559131 RepID=A0ABD2MSL1_9CUCU